MSQTVEIDSLRTPKQKPERKIMSHLRGRVEHVGFTKSGAILKPNDFSAGIAVLADIIADREIPRLREEGKIA